MAKGTPLSVDEVKNILERYNAQSAAARRMAEPGFRMSMDGANVGLAGYEANRSRGRGTGFKQSGASSQATEDQSRLFTAYESWSRDVDLIMSSDMNEDFKRQAVGKAAERWREISGGDGRFDAEAAAKLAPFKDDRNWFQKVGDSPLGNVAGKAFNTLDFGRSVVQSSAYQFGGVLAGDGWDWNEWKDDVDSRTPWLEYISRGVDLEELPSLVKGGLVGFGFLADVATDPTSYIGLGVVGQATKTLSRTGVGTRVFEASRIAKALGHFETAADLEQAAARIARVGKSAGTAKEYELAQSLLAQGPELFRTGKIGWEVSDGAYDLTKARGLYIHGPRNKSFQLLGGNDRVRPFQAVGEARAAVGDLWRNTKLYANLSGQGATSWKPLQYAGNAEKYVQFQEMSRSFNRSTGLRNKFFEEVVEGQWGQVQPLLKNVDGAELRRALDGAVGANIDSKIVGTVRDLLDNAVEAHNFGLPKHLQIPRLENYFPRMPEEDMINFLKLHGVVPGTVTEAGVARLKSSPEYKRLLTPGTDFMGTKLVEPAAHPAGLSVTEQIGEIASEAASQVGMEGVLKLFKDDPVEVIDGYLKLLGHRKGFNEMLSGMLNKGLVDVFGNLEGIPKWRTAQLREAQVVEAQYRRTVTAEAAARARLKSTESAIVDAMARQADLGLDVENVVVSRVLKDPKFHSTVRDLESARSAAGRALGDVQKATEEWVAGSARVAGEAASDAGVVAAAEAMAAAGEKVVPVRERLSGLTASYKRVNNDLLGLRAEAEKLSREIADVRKVASPAGVKGELDRLFDRLETVTNNMFDRVEQGAFAYSDDLLGQADQIKMSLADILGVSQDNPTFSDVLLRAETLAAAGRLPEGTAELVRMGQEVNVLRQQVEALGDHIAGLERFGVSFADLPTIQKGVSVGQVSLGDNGIVLGARGDRWSGKVARGHPGSVDVWDDLTDGQINGMRGSARRVRDLDVSMGFVVNDAPLRNTDARLGQVLDFQVSPTSTRVIDGGGVVLSPGLASRLPVGRAVLDLEMLGLGVTQDSGLLKRLAAQFGPGRAGASKSAFDDVVRLAAEFGEHGSLPTALRNVPESSVLFKSLGGAAGLSDTDRELWLAHELLGWLGQDEVKGLSRLWWGLNSDFDSLVYEGFGGSTMILRDPRSVVLQGVPNSAERHFVVESLQVFNESVARGFRDADQVLRRLEGEINPAIGSQTAKAQDLESNIFGVRDELSRLQRGLDEAEAVFDERFAPFQAELDVLGERWAGFADENVRLQGRVSELEQQLESISGAARKGVEAELKATQDSLVALRLQAAAESGWVQQSAGELMSMEQLFKQMSNPDVFNSVAEGLRSGFVRVGFDLQGTGVAADFINELAELGSPERFRDFTRFFDKAQGSFKAWALMSPGFHVRNWYGGAWNMHLAGVDMRSFKTFADASWGRTTDSRVLRVFDEIASSGVVSSGRAQALSTEAQAALGAGGGVGAKLFRADLGPLNVFKNLNNKAAGVVEKYLRGTHMLDGMLKGMTFDEALADMLKYHFDYTDLSRFESSVAKRVAPFYTWTRYNVPLQVEAMVSQPQKFMRYLRAMDAVEQLSEVEDSVPQFFVDMLAFRTPFRGDTGNKYLGFDMPFNDILDLDSAAVLSMSSPFIQAPLELFGGKKIFSGAPIPGGYEELPSVVSRIPGLKQVFTTAGLGKVNSSGDLVVPSRLTYAVQSFVPMWERLNRVSGSGQSATAKQNQGAAIISVLLGFQFRENNDRARAGEVYRQREEMHNIVRDAIDLGFGGDLDYRESGTVLSRPQRLRAENLDEDDLVERAMIRLMENPNG